MLSNVDSNPFPEWLTSKFLEIHLRNYYKNNDLQIIDFLAKSASEEGIGCASLIYRVNVTLTYPSNINSSAEQVSFIIIIILTNIFCLKVY